MAVLVILGHWLDFFNMIIARNSGVWLSGKFTFLLVVGAFLFMVKVYSF